jgi:septal ring-binding cell division protein DamX
MDNGIFQILLIVTFLFIGIVKAYHKTKTKKMDDDNSNQKSIDNDYYHKNEKKTLSQPVSPRITTTFNTTPSQSLQSPILSGNSNSEEETNFSILSPEDAKRAVIWSEIIQRKY